MLSEAIGLTLFPATMAFAAASDLLTMTIANRLSLVLVAGFAIAAMLGGLSATVLFLHLAAGAAVLAVAFFCFACRWIGGGDAKLAAATALWLGFANLFDYLIYVSLLGGALTAMAASDVLGVPAAFSFIGQDMILNVAALSSIASLAEFVPPTSISAALACYVVGGGTVGQVFRRAWPPLAVLAALALLMLIFAPQLAGVLT